MSESAKWYVVHTYSGYENKVAATIEKVVENHNLQDLIHAVNVPVENVVEIKDGKRKEIERKVFPGYVLVKMVLTDDSWHVVRNTCGVTGFVGPASKPIPLTDEEVSELGVEKRELTVNYSVGDSVKIIDGALEDFIGVVDEISLDKNKIRVIVSMFGRETPVELEPDQVRLVED
jgi:transcriptional antiterminator NusG